MAPVSVRKEVGLSCTVRITLGSVEVMRVGAWGPGHLQSSAASPRRLGRAGLKYSYLDQEGMSGSPEGGLGSRSSNVPLCHSWNMDLEGTLALGMSGPGAFFATFEAGLRWPPFFVG